MQDRDGRTQREEKFAGLILIAAAALAVIAANTRLAPAYHAVFATKLGPPMPILGVLDLDHWISDGLMAVFFLLVGLEVKREWYVGRLAGAAQCRLPIIAAAAGMAVPALVYLAAARFDPALARGWAIPSATDIAFAIGILALMGSRANPSIKLLLVTIAIVDDIGAVLIIALVYTSGLNGLAIGCAAALLAAMFAMNRFGIRTLWPYLLAFVLLWFAMLASGIHATIAGVLAALAIPLGNGEDRSPLRRLEHRIHPWVMFGIVPLFGLASAGVEIGSASSLLQPLPLAVAAGLFLGKQAGVFGAIWVADRTGLAPRPQSASWTELYGAAMLCGVGFTMSLFIGALAFPARPLEIEAAKLGTLLGSLASAIAGFVVLSLGAASSASDSDRNEAREIFAEDWDDEKAGKP